MNKFLRTLLLSAVVITASAQSKTTVSLEEKYDASLSLFFYKNTLRMLNQQENPEFDELVRGIEKMKFLLVDKSKGDFGSDEYNRLISDYQKEKFEAIVTSRVDGRNLDVYLRDAEKSKPGTVILVNDSSSLYVLDIVGSIDVSKAGSLFSVIGGSTDIGSRIKQFTERESDSVRNRKRRMKAN